MPRNRLNELQAASKHTPDVEEEEMAPLKKKKDKNEEGGNDFQAFLDAMADVVEKVDQAEKNTIELRSLQRKLLTSTHKDETNEKRMEDLMEENKRLAMSIRRVIQTEQQWVDKNSPDSSSSPSKKKILDKQQLMEWRMRKTQVAAQSRRFFNIWTEYNNNQVEYRDKSKKLLVKRCQITNNSFTDEQIETMLDEGNTAVFATSILDEERLARQQLTELQDRHDEFVKLEKSIREVHEMFVEVAALVAQQGELVDNIAANVNAAQADIEKGKEHLSSAERNANSARKKKICLFSVLVIVILIVVLVILSEFEAFSGGSSKGAEQPTFVVVKPEETTTSRHMTTTSVSSHTTTTTAPA